MFFGERRHQRWLETPARRCKRGVSGLSGALGSAANLEVCVGTREEEATEDVGVDNKDVDGAMERSCSRAEEEEDEEELFEAKTDEECLGVEEVTMDSPL